MSKRKRASWEIRPVELKGKTAEETVAKNPSHTHPSLVPTPDAKPGGKKTKINPKDKDKENIRALTRENESAITLARLGYKVVQNPPLDSNKNPDYLIESRIFDNYAPGTKNASNIASAIFSKVCSGQTQRIVLNLKNSEAVVGEILKELHDNQDLKDLEEIIMIDKNDEVSHIYP